MHSMREVREREESRTNLTFLTQTTDWVVEPSAEMSYRGGAWSESGGEVDNRVGFESVGFEGLVGFVSGTQERLHLINRWEGICLCIKGKERALRKESWGMPTLKDPLGREPEGGLRGNAERQKLGRSRELPIFRHY